MSDAKITAVDGWRPIRRTITGRNQRGEVIATIEEEREVARRR